MSVVDDILHCI